ncbi:hypothetical protein TTX_1901 [Thermoproteus tenax Kra 1]|uniref:Uncharacterized protein n=1 Tax=Thermoproteus tenax (strain ATCC 35583 / DSM 2078 / JCM 9277 / NBRC 100435 / Kra 1) TaxID=768679 RepID=G4RLS2_THETK|nr:hypothetical protein TTX_1901 [Thermoproteus tenax Kra 1]
MAAPRPSLGARFGLPGAALRQLRVRGSGPLGTGLAPSSPGPGTGVSFYVKFYVKYSN